MDLELITAAFPTDPVIDIALTHALLIAVADGRRSAALRVFRPGPTAAFGRLDALVPGFEHACARAREHGFTPLVRSVGGHAALFDESCIVLERVSREDDATSGLSARFEDQSLRVRAALASLGLDARTGALRGEYCAGAHSINVGGRFKVAGIAQRIISRGAATSAVVVAGGGPRLRAAIEAVYAALAIPVDASVAGALDEALPGLTVEQVAKRLQDAYTADARLVPRAPGTELLDAARALAERHRVP
jgi:octanoyl-[GcvH]:protein N-octanoyltransferase